MEKFYVIQFWDKFIVYNKDGKPVKRGLSLNQANNYVKDKGGKPVKCCYLYMIGQLMGIIGG